MKDRSRLVAITIRNLGCIGPQGLTVELDNIVCLVGRNNSGKSTVLRAYELARENRTLSDDDRCQWSPKGAFPEVELSVHIPEGVENVDEKWKVIRNGLRIVRSRWIWKSSGKPERQTWSPEMNEGQGDWEMDGKAGGADNVFKSRLPQPLRIDALKDSAEAHGLLMSLVLDPIIAQLEELKTKEGSELREALKAVAESTKQPIAAYQAKIDEVAQRIGAGITDIFPNLGININVGIDPPALDAKKSLIAGSSVRFTEDSAETGLAQQGAGSRRAMFWSLMQVRSELESQRMAAESRVKAVRDIQTKLAKENQKQKPKDEVVAQLTAQLEAIESSGQEVSSLPGYILLIDEPENCLHPMAVRAARKYLYALAKDENWQVMLSTHSPYFVDPLEDHTTIVRIERVGRSTTPRTFRADSAVFSSDEQQNLRALLQLDASLSEVFFGSYPILVEGDTEAAAFIAAIPEKGHPLASSVTVVNARGKALIRPLIKLLTHFSVSFGVLHDTDYPARKAGGTNSMWTENLRIAEQLNVARSRGLEIRHRVSVPDFERSLGLPETEKDKPISVYRAVSDSLDLQAEVARIFSDLISSDSLHPAPNLIPAASIEAVVNSIREKVINWAAANAPGDPRYLFPDTAGPQVVSEMTGA